MKKFVIFFFLSTQLLNAFAQKQENLYYINKYKAIAIDEMIRCGIPASITLAQGLHESGCGKSPLSREANNHFGIKCKDEWTGKKYYQNDDAPNECFRVYHHAEASYADHSDFLVTRPRYAVLFKLPVTDYKGWAHGLKDCGYATNPKYAHILIREIEEYKLYEFDQQALVMIAERDKMLAYSGTQEKSPSPSAPVLVHQAPATPAIKESAPLAMAENKTTVVETTPARDKGRKQYMVNGSLALIAMANEEPLKIAFDHNIDYSYVLMFNDLQPGEHFKEGEYVYLQAKKNRGSSAAYTAQAGESMRDISQKTGVKLKELYQKNLMQMNEQVPAGETLYLQDKRTSVPRTISYAEFLKTQVVHTHAAAVTKTAGDTNTTTKGSATATQAPTKQPIKYTPTQYQVQASDTLYSIARKFNITVQELKEMNNLQTANIREGQKLVILK